MNLTRVKMKGWPGPFVLGALFIVRVAADFLLGRNPEKIGGRLRPENFFPSAF